MAFVDRRRRVSALLAIWTEKLVDGPQAGISESATSKGLREWVDNTTTILRTGYT